MQLNEWEEGLQLASFLFTWCFHPKYPAKIDCVYLEFVAVGIDASTKFKQNFGHTTMSGGGRLHEWRVSVLIMVLYVGSSLKKYTNNLYININIYL